MNKYPFNHLGKPCVYNHQKICQEGICIDCEVPITCSCCGLVDPNKVRLINYQGDEKPYCDDTIGCIDRGAKRIANENLHKAIKDIP